MTPPEDRTRLESHPYIDVHDQNTHELDLELDQSAENPFWSPESPASTDTAWRYMDLAKLISILQRESIWFSHHSNFEDPYEGRYSEITVENIRSEYDGLGLDTPDSVDEDGTIGFENYVSCWNVKEEQSVALWDMYTDGENGVAIKTTIEDLENSIESAISENPIESEIDLAYDFDYMSGKVVYRSGENEPRGYYGPIFAKRPIFDFENEYRMVFTSSGSHYYGPVEEDPSLPTDGIPVPANVELLIDEVYISPSAGSYVKKVVERLRDDLGYDFNVEKSPLIHSSR